MSDAAFKVGNKYCVRCHNSLKNEARVYTSPSCGHQICRKCYIEIDFTVTCFEKDCSKKLRSREWISTKTFRNIGDELADAFHSTHLSITKRPGEVKNLRVTLVTVNKIDVAWDQPSRGGKPTTYILQKKEYGHIEWLFIDEINSNETTYCVTDLKPDTWYTIQVIASNDAGKSCPRGVYQQTKVLAPESPVDIQVHDVTSSSVTVKWRVRHGSSKPSGFEIKVKDFQTSNYLQIYSTNRNERYITDLKPDHRYVFYIAARNSGGISNYVDISHKTKPNYAQSRVSQREVENIEMTNTEDETNIIASRKRPINEEDEKQSLINELFDHNSGNASKVSRHESGSDIYYIRGLPNVGMTCYANSILQVLAQTPELITHLQLLMRKFALNTESLAGNLFDVLSDINMEITNTGNDRRQNESVSTNKVYQLVCKVVKSDSSFQIGRQNDSHSFLITLFNAIKNEISKKNTKEEVLGIFEGTFLSRFTYYPCKHDAVSELQMFNTLLVPIDDYKVSWSIEDGIGSLLMTEKFHNNALPCGKCNHAENKTITEKTMTFERLPKILILQLGKFKQKSRHLEKIHKIVYYSHTLETSLLKPNMARDRKCYRLYGVTLHSGSLSGGHYTAYVRCNETVNGGEDQWYDCSDSYVRKIPKDRVLDDEQAFLLFYYLSDIN